MYPFVEAIQPGELYCPRTSASVTPRSSTRCASNGPSGLVQALHGVAPKQFLTVTEPARLEVLGPGTFHVQSWKGMAFEVKPSSELKQWSPVTTATNLTGTLEFTDTDAENQSRRFHRTVLK